jgi:hypothetical protein
MRPCLEKNLSQERAGGVAQGVGPEFKPQHHTHTHKKTAHRCLWQLYSQLPKCRSNQDILQKINGLTVIHQTMEYNSALKKIYQVLKKQGI